MEPAKATEMAVVQPGACGSAAPVIVGQPVQISGAPGAQNVGPSKELWQDKPGCTCLTCVGNGILGLEIASFVIWFIGMVMEWFVMGSDLSFLRLLRIFDLLGFVEIILASVGVVVL